MSLLQQKISRWSLCDGAGLAGMGFLSLLLAAQWRDFTGALVGVALLTLGGIELRGRGLLLRGEKRATRWLVGSQLGLLLVILAYCLRSLAHPPVVHLEAVPWGMLDRLDRLPGFEGRAGQAEDLLPPLLKVSYSLAMLVSVLYQGSMAMFYLRKTPLALQSPPPLPAEIGRKGV